MIMESPRIQPLSHERFERLAGDPARRRLLEQMATATTLEEIDAGRRAQRAWLILNPDDFGVLEAGEDLTHAEEALVVEVAPVPGTRS